MTSEWSMFVCDRWPPRGSPTHAMSDVFAVFALRQRFSNKLIKSTKRQIKTCDIEFVLRKNGRRLFRVDQVFFNDFFYSVLQAIRMTKYLHGKLHPVLRASHHVGNPCFWFTDHRKKT